MGELHGGRGTPERMIYDSLTTCSFLRRELAKIFGSAAGWGISMLNAACGWNLTREEWDRIVLRGFTMERCYSIREGYLPEKDDVPSDRFFNETIFNKYGEPKSLSREEFLSARKEVYRVIRTEV